MSRLFLRQADTTTCCKVLQCKSHQTNHHLLRVKTPDRHLLQHVGSCKSSARVPVACRQSVPCSEPAVLPTQPARCELKPCRIKHKPFLGGSAATSCPGKTADRQRLPAWLRPAVARPALEKLVHKKVTPWQKPSIYRDMPKPVGRGDSHQTQLSLHKVLPWCLVQAATLPNAHKPHAPRQP